MATLLDAFRAKVDAAAFYKDSFAHTLREARDQRSIIEGTGIRALHLLYVDEAIRYLDDDNSDMGHTRSSSRGRDANPRNPFIQPRANRLNPHPREDTQPREPRLLVQNPHPEPGTSSHHPRREPRAQSLDSRQRRCFKCSGLGHLKKECPNRRCQYCKKRNPGHLSSRCHQNPERHRRLMGQPVFQRGSQDERARRPPSSNNRRSHSCDSHSDTSVRALPSHSQRVTPDSSTPFVPDNIVISEQGAQLIPHPRSRDLVPLDLHPNYPFTFSFGSRPSIPQTRRHHQYVSNRHNQNRNGHSSTRNQERRPRVMFSHADLFDVEPYDYDSGAEHNMST